MSDPWSEEPEAVPGAHAAPRLPLAQSAPEFGEADPIDLEDSSSNLAAGKKPWQFSLARLQLLIVILCVCSACLGALLHVNEEDFSLVAIFLLILPSGVLIVLGIGRGGYEVYKAWRADQALWTQEPWQSNQTTLPPEEK